MADFSKFCNAYKIIWRENEYEKIKKDHYDNSHNYYYDGNDGMFAAGTGKFG